MPIFILRDAVLVPSKKKKIKRERDMEDWLENSPWALVEDEFILWIDRQPSAQDEEGTIHPDLLGVDSEGNLVIVEFKRGRTPRDVVAQLLEYAAWANELSDAEIREIAEDYFETQDEFEEREFHNAFRDTFNIPDTDDLPSLNQKMRLFIVAEEIPSRMARVCRFLRTSHIMDINCIDVSAFKTESCEILVSTETIVGNEDLAAHRTQYQRTSPPSDPPEPLNRRQTVYEAVQEFTQGNREVEFTIRDILALIREDDPNFPRPTMDGIMIADTVNHPSRYYVPPSAREDYYWRVERGKYRLYDPERDEVQDSE